MQRKILSQCARAGKKVKQLNKKIAQIGTKWAGNDYSDIWLSQQKAQSGTPLILFFTLVWRVALSERLERRLVKSQEKT